MVGKLLGKRPLGIMWRMEDNIKLDMLLSL